MSKSPAALAVGLAVILLFVFASHSRANPPTADTQDAEYAYDVLPGLHSDQATPVDLDATQGWHSSSLAIDMVPTSGDTVGSTTFASFHPVTPSSNIAARVDLVVRSGTGCRTVHVQLYRKDSDEPIGTVMYTHVLPSILPGKDVPLSAGASTPLGTLAEAAWVSVSWNTDDLGQAINAEIQARLNAVGSGFTADGVGTVGRIQHVTVNRVRYAVRQMFGWQESGGRSQGWYEQRWRNAASPGNADGATCPSTSAHLHQAASASSAAPSGLQLNRDSAYNLDDDGFGFPAGQLSRLRFCSDTWVFRLQSSQTAPLASPVQPCGAPATAPANLTAAGGDRRIALHWDDPNDATITEYEIRRRLSNVSSTTANPWTAWATIRGSGAGTTSHTVPQLNNETAYTLQIRAVNANGYGPAGTASATPTVTVPSAAPDLTLTTLALSGASLTFDSATTSYAVTVDDDLSRTTLTATPNNSNASLTITPGDANPDTDAHEVDLAVGVTTITIEVAHLGETRSYTVTITRPDPLVAPVITSFSVSGTTLTGNFTWSGSSPRFLRWRLYQANSESGTYNAIGSAVEDSLSPVTYSGQTRDRWYKLRGQACEHRAAVGAQGANANSRQAAQTVIVCGAWSANSDAVEIAALRPPSPPTCGARPSQHLSETETLSPTYSWTVAGDIASYIKTTVTRTRSRPEGVWQGHPTCAWKHGNWGEWKAEASTEVVRIETRPADQTDIVSKQIQKEWRVEGSEACEWTQYSDQPQTKRAEWSDTSESWVFGGDEDWVDDGDPSRRWAGPGICKSRPADQARTVPTLVKAEWRVGSSEACEWTQYSDQPQTKRATWVAPNWVFGGDEDWVDNGDPSLRWAEPDSCVAKPADKTVTVTEQQTRLGPPVFAGTSFCVQYPEKRSRSAYYHQPYVWDASATAWELGKRAATPYSYSLWTAWTRTGERPQPCAFSALPSGSWSLASGDYELEWSAQRVLFTVPDDASVELSWRARDGGGQEAVFSVAGEGELTVHPDSLDASSGAASGESSERPTLDAIEDSLTLVETSAD